MSKLTLQSPHIQLRVPPRRLTWRERLSGRSGGESWDLSAYCRSARMDTDIESVGVLGWDVDFVGLPWGMFDVGPRE